MSHPVPTYVAKQYGGARGFRSEKRKQLRALNKLLGEFRCGCAFFPNDGALAVSVIEENLDALAKSLSVETWGK